LKQEAANLRTKIEKATENLMFSDDPRTRKDLDAMISQMRDELDRKTAESEAEQSDGNGSLLYTQDDMTRLGDWWESFCQEAVHVPLEPGK